MRFFIFFGLLICFDFTFAQVKVYFDRFDLEVSTPDSSIYYLEARLDENGFFQDSVKYYFTHSKRLRGYETYDRGILQGPFCFYFENGNTFKKGSANKGVPVEELLIWYPTGQLRQLLRAREFTYLDQFEMKYQFISCFDPEGKALVENGFGFFDDQLFISSVPDPQVTRKTIKLDSAPKQWNFSQRSYVTQQRAKGRVVDGHRDSVWQVFIKDTLRHVENLVRGKLLGGQSFFGGKTYRYTEIETSASPVGGMENFYRTIMSKIQYPRTARRNGIQGKVFVEFVVNVDGKLTDIKIKRGIGGGCDEAAVDAVRQSPLWNPGLQFGIPVRQRFTVPVIFRL